MKTSCAFITSDYVITFGYSHLHVLRSELIQSKSALNQHWKPNALEIKKSATLIQSRFFFEKELFKKALTLRKQSWSALKQRWSALMFFMFSDSALKNVKSLMKECCTKNSEIKKLGNNPFSKTTYRPLKCQLAKNEPRNSTPGIWKLNEYFTSIGQNL